VGALGHYLEREGLPTTQISLVREHTVALAPPRALWVPFMLGRPFGVPGNAAFQERVLRAALELLEQPGPGPLLKDFPDEAPYDDLGTAPQGLVCPVSFPPSHVPGRLPLAQAFVDEAGQLEAWHALAVRQRGRTTLGVTGLAIDELTRFVAAWIGDAPPALFADGLSAGEALKLACDEIKAYYYEARSMQPGRHSSGAIQDWFWMHTAAGRVFLALRDKAAASNDPSMERLASLSLVPRAVDAAMAAMGGKT
jgi:hypothetical protein